jgi:hypothetical protein
VSSTLGRMTPAKERRWAQKATERQPATALQMLTRGGYAPEIEKVRGTQAGPLLPFRGSLASRTCVYKRA